jgi:benzoyl-CoA reductase/2-hydroxyglutaryl-CoA dehydratase subunit BcrC/BadD/HgdB
MTMAIGNRNSMETLVRSLKLIERMKRGRNTPKSETLYYQMLTDYFSNILNARNEGKFLLLHTIFLPTEIFYAMNIVPMLAETTGWMISAFTGTETELLAKGTELGLPTEICSAHRVLAGGFALERMPRPDAIVWSNLSCDNSAKSSELLLEMSPCPGFFIDHPFKDSENEMQYMVAELQDLVTFLEQTTGKKMDWGLLSQHIEHTQQQIDLLRGISNLRKAVPSPFPVHRFAELMMTNYLFSGLPENIDYLNQLKKELEEMVAVKKGCIPGERYRIMSLFMPPLYLMGFLEEIFRKHGAVSVVEPLFSQWGNGNLEPSKPLESLANKSFMLPESCTYGPLDDRIINNTVECAREYKVDAAIFYAHVGCRQASALIRTYKEILGQVDVPMLILDCDIVDPTITSSHEIRKKMEEFFEFLDDR